MQRNTDTYGFSGNHDEFEDGDNVSDEDDYDYVDAQGQAYYAKTEGLVPEESEEFEEGNAEPDLETALTAVLRSMAPDQTTSSVPLVTKKIPVRFAFKHDPDNADAPGEWTMSNEHIGNVFGDAAKDMAHVAKVRILKSSSTVPYPVYLSAAGFMGGSKPSALVLPETGEEVALRIEPGHHAHDDTVYENSNIDVRCLTSKGVANIMGELEACEDDKQDPDMKWVPPTSLTGQLALENAHRMIELADTGGELEYNTQTGYVKVHKKSIQDILDEANKTHLKTMESTPLSAVSMTLSRADRTPGSKSELAFTDAQDAPNAGPATIKNANTRNQEIAVVAEVSIVDPAFIAAAK